MYLLEAFLGHDHEHGHGHSHGEIHPEDSLEKIEKFTEENKPQRIKLKDYLKSKIHFKRLGNLELNEIN